MRKNAQQRIVSSRLLPFLCIRCKSGEGTREKGRGEGGIQLVRKSPQPRRVCSRRTSLTTTGSCSSPRQIGHVSSELIDRTVRDKIEPDGKSGRGAATYSYGVSSTADALE
jgi:hypothetical protein